MIELSDICYKIKSNCILRNISCFFKKGEITTIIGPNGAGKTTLLRIILGLIKPTSGKISLNKKIKMKYAPQLHQRECIKLLPITVNRFLQIGCKKSAFNNDKIKKNKIKDSMCDNLLQINPLFHNLLSLKDLPLHSLSGGELQKVMISRLILSEYDVLILDEPTQGIDLEGQEEFYKIISFEKKDKNKCIIIVSHDIHAVSASSDKVLCVNRSLCCHGNSKEIIGSEKYNNVLNNWKLFTHTHK